MTGEGEALTPEEIDRLEAQLNRVNGLLMVARASIAEVEELETARVARREVERRGRRRDWIAQALVLGAGSLLIVGAALINLAVQVGWLAP